MNSALVTVPLAPRVSYLAKACKITSTPSEPPPVRCRSVKRMRLYLSHTGVRPLTVNRELLGIEADGPEWIRTREGFVSVVRVWGTGFRAQRRGGRQGRWFEKEAGSTVLAGYVRFPPRS
mmetsp:Transcript_14269/g.23472  ORF Transcript_14269/g.23472 Transcript_14269/m.23472 type:complete len:120 (-) Transcript_14269:32-391(-)